MISGVPIWTGAAGAVKLGHVLDRKQEPPDRGPEKSGAFSPAVSVGRSVAAGSSGRQADRRKAPGKAPGAAHRWTGSSRTGGPRWRPASSIPAPRPGRRRKRAARRTASRDGGVLRARYSYPGSLIYTPPIAPQTGRRLTASTSTGTEQGHSLQPTGQPYSPQQAAASRQQPAGNRAGARRSQQQSHSPTASQQTANSSPTASSGQPDDRPARRHPKRARARIKTRPRA